MLESYLGAHLRASYCRTFLIQPTIIVAILLVLRAPWGVSAAYACAPDKMVKVQVTTEGWNLNPGAFGTMPKTMYRLGSRYARIGEAADRPHGVHFLFVISEPDVWQVNLIDMDTMHVTDQGPTFECHLALLGGGVAPKELERLEFGCEVEFFRYRQIAPSKRDSADEYVYKSGDWKVTLVVDAKTRKPITCEFWYRGKIHTKYTYQVYEVDLEPQMGLFAPPPGIRVREGRPR